MLIIKMIYYLNKCMKKMHLLPPMKMKIHTFHNNNYKQEVSVNNLKDDLY